MLCGYCKSPVKGIASFKKHLRENGCSWNRGVWEKHYRSRQAGHSGRRILSQAFPNIYPPRPMSDECKERLQALTENRKGMNLGRQKKARKRRKVS